MQVQLDSLRGEVSSLRAELASLRAELLELKTLALGEPAETGDTFSLVGEPPGKPWLRDIPLRQQALHP